MYGRTRDLDTPPQGRTSLRQLKGRHLSFAVEGPTQECHGYQVISALRCVILGTAQTITMGPWMWGISVVGWRTQGPSRAGCTDWLARDRLPSGAGVFIVGVRNS